MPQGLPAGADMPQTETRFMSTWQDVYSPSVPWYVTGGYMDWMGNATAERALTGSDDGKWNYPDLWHTFTVPVAETGETLQVILVDTVTLSGAMLNNPGQQNIPEGAIPGDSTLAMEVEGAQIVTPTPKPVIAAATAAAATTTTAPKAAATATAATAATATATAATTKAATTATAVRRRPARRSLLGGIGEGLERLGGGRRRRLTDFNVNGNPPISTVQWSWLENTLEESKANWIIVVGNDPIWSVGAHGPTWALVDQMLPILNSNGVAFYISGRDPVAQHIAPSITYPNVDFIGTGNGAYSNASQAQWVPMLNSNPSSSLRFCSGKDTGFVTVTHSGAAANSTSRLTVTFIDSSGDQIYTYSKSNPRDLPVIPLDKQTTGVETVLSIGDGDGAPVSPAVMVICLLVIVAVLGVAFIINRAEGDESAQLAQTAAKVLKEKDSGAWGPAQKGKAGGSGAEQGGNTVVRSSAAPPGAERRPLLPKKRLDINTDL